MKPARSSSASTAISACAANCKSASGFRADRRAKLLFCQESEGSPGEADSQTISSSARGAQIPLSRLLGCQICFGTALNFGGRPLRGVSRCGFTEPSRAVRWPFRFAPSVRLLTTAVVRPIAFGRPRSKPRSGVQGVEFSLMVKGDIRRRLNSLTEESTSAHGKSPARLFGVCGRLKHGIAFPRQHRVQTAPRQAIQLMIQGQN